MVLNMEIKFPDGTEIIDMTYPELCDICHKLPSWIECEDKNGIIKKYCRDCAYLAGKVTWATVKYDDEGNLESAIPDLLTLLNICYQE